MRIAVIATVLTLALAASVPVARAGSVPLRELRLVAEESGPKVPGLTASADTSAFAYSTFSTVSNSNKGHNGIGGGHGGGRRTTHADRSQARRPLVEVHLRCARRRTPVRNRAGVAASAS